MMCTVREEESEEEEREPQLGPDLCGQCSTTVPLRVLQNMYVQPCQVLPQKGTLHGTPL